MDIFTKNKLLVRLIAAVMILNLATIGFICWHRGPKPERRLPGPREGEVSAVLEDKLQLTPEQTAKISEIRASFFQKEAALSRLIRDQRDSMNLLMFNEQTDSAQLRQLAQRVAGHEFQMELYRIEQAEQLKTICNAGQLKKFRKLVGEIRDYFKPEKKNEQ